MAYILGLDLGPTSIGWAAVELDANGEPANFARIKNISDDGKSHEYIPAIGCRLFPAGVENLNQGQREEPKNKKRREKRSIRRRLRRARARRQKLIVLLTAKRLLSSDLSLEKIHAKDPYELRTRALKEKISPEDFARILLHFSKRRGFQSNRKKPETDSGASDMKKARERLNEELEGKTLGVFWHEKLRANPFDPIRNRQGQYHWIAQRDQYREELAKIWQKQSGFWPEILTHDFYKSLEPLLFDQIRFELSERKKKKIIGTCSLIQGKPRCPYSERIAQKFRILQKINDLVIQFPDETERALNEKERKTLYDALMNTKALPFKKMRKLLWGNEDQEVNINLEYKANDGIKGNEIDSSLGSSVFRKKDWQNVDDETRERIWTLIQNGLFGEYQHNPRELSGKITEEFGLTFSKENWYEKINEPQGYCNYSRAALERILPHMISGLNLYEAIEKENFTKAWTQHALLPLPDRKHGFQIPNPVVRSMLFQLRRVVNLIIKELGPPQEIVIETARELKANKDKRKEITARQAENQKDRAACEKRIREQRGWNDDVDVPATDVIKYRLWEQQNHYCPYSCKKIPMTKLFEREVEIDHILPYSMSLDNTMNNRVVCFAEENQQKRQNTPISWLGETNPKWHKIQEAMARNAFNFPDGKWERFSVKNEEIAEKYQPERLLRDTSYITREVRSYLKRLYPAAEAEQKVRTTKGPITAELRNLWNINAILRDGEIGPKNRDDLRHHAVDAAVIAVTRQRMIQKITRELQDIWPKRPKCAAIAEPWDGFGRDLAEAVETINISHRVQRKIRGALHAETNYWEEGQGINKGKYVTRKNLSDLTPKMVDQICDEKIRWLIHDRLEEHDGDVKKAFEEPLVLSNDNGQTTEIKKVRVWRNAKNMIRINEYIWVEPGSNHHVEIVTHTNGTPKQDGFIVTMYEAAQRARDGKELICREHDHCKFEFSLSINEMFMLKMEDGSCHLHRIQKMDQNGSIILRPHTYGGKLSDTDKPPLIQRKSTSTIKGYKVTVDPVGRIRRAND